MPSIDIYATSSESGVLVKTDATYSNVTDATTADAAGTPQFSALGQEGPLGYTASYVFAGFDLSVLPSSATILEATLSIKSYAASTYALSGYWDAILYDYGATIDTSDYLTADEFTAETPVASWTDTSITSDVWLPFVSASSFATSLTEGQTNRLILMHRDFGNKNQPAFTENKIIVYTGNNSTTTNRPKLTISYTGADSIYFGTNM